MQSESLTVVEDVFWDEIDCGEMVVKCEIMVAVFNP